MVVILYQTDTFSTSRTKLGGADSFLVEKRFTMDMGPKLVVTSGDVYVEGYDPLVTQAHRDLNVTPVSVTERQNYELVIASLVHMIGGSVTIADHEMSGARKLQMSSFWQQDPRMFVIRTEEKQ